MLIFNEKILEFLKNNLTLENLQKSCFKGSTEDFLSKVDTLSIMIIKHPKIRWIQLLYNMNLANEEEDRYYEPSAFTYKYLLNMYSDSTQWTKDESFEISKQEFIKSLKALEI